MWYRFEEGNPVGIPRIKNYQVAWYDMTRDSSCFDELFFEPNEVGKVMPYIETVEDEGKHDRSKVFVHFDDGDMYELKLVKVDKDKCSRFYDCDINDTNCEKLSKIIETLQSDLNDFECCVEIAKIVGIYKYNKD